VEGRTDCERCHEDATTWAELVFDHDRQSRFPLEDAHARLICAACHPTESIDATKAVDEEDQGLQITRFKPLRTDCVGCHGSQRAPLQRRKRSGGEGR
jgi:hypothetical protein